MSEEERKPVKASLLGWRYNTRKHGDPEWIHLNNFPEGYSRGGQITLTQVGIPGDKPKWALPSRFQQGAEGLMPFHSGLREAQVDVLVEIDGRIHTCRHRGDLKPLEFTAGATMKTYKGGDTEVDPQAFVNNIKNIIEQHRKMSELYLEMYSAIAREYGEW